MPLGDGTSARCPYCAADVAIPKEYLTLRDDDREEVAARKRAAEMIAELAAPLPLPILVFQKLGAAAYYVVCTIIVVAFILGLRFAFSEGGGGLILTLLFAVLIALLAVPLVWEWLLHAVADRLHVDLVDRLSGFGAHLLLGVFVVVFLLVPLALGYYARRMIAVRTKLQQEFASKPSARPGGPATCRHCDAPLDVPAGALGVRCLYCGTDNLVAVSAAVAKATAASANKSSKAIDDAFSEQFEVRYYTKNRLKAVPVLAVLVIPLFGCLGLLTEVVMDEGGATGHRTRASGPPMLYGEGNKRPQGEVALDCGGTCTFYVPLVHGQTIVVDGGDSVVVQRRDIGHWYQLDWWNWTALEPGPVKHTGWYRLIVESSDRNQKLTWSVK